MSSLGYVVVHMDGSSGSVPMIPYVDPTRYTTLANAQARVYDLINSTFEDHCEDRLAEIADAVQEKLEELYQEFCTNVEDELKGIFKTYDILLELPIPAKNAFDNMIVARTRPSYTAMDTAFNQVVGVMEEEVKNLSVPLDLDPAIFVNHQGTWTVDIDALGLDSTLLQYVAIQEIVNDE